MRRSTTPGMRRLIRTLHKYISLSLAAVWFLQAATGVINVFHREIDDALLGVPPTPVDIEALGSRIEALQATRPRVSSVYAGGGVPGQFDIFVRDDAGATRVVRVDGAGNILRERPWAHDFADAGFIHLARIFHESLLAGDFGLWLVGLSGFFLFTNIALGVKLAWARRGEWRRALVPPAAGNAAARLFGWHRALGLWLALPALILTGSGVLVAWSGMLEEWLGSSAPPPAATAVPTGEHRIGPAEGMRIALARYPGSSLSIVNLPTQDAPWYRVRLLQPEENRRVFGTTTVYVSACNGTILADYNALQRPAKVDFLDALYPIHTGEIVGLAGRILALLVGVWLVAMLVLGVSLWLRRRKPYRRPAGAVREAGT